jgi:hypothetical protein
VFDLRKSWANTGRLSLDLIEGGGYDVAIGDEAYDLAIVLAESTRPPQCPCFVLFDFLGMDTMTWNPLERVVVMIFNRIWAKNPRGRYQPVFLGEIEDIPPRTFGPFLPNRRVWAERYALIVGHVLSFDPAEYHDRAALRTRLGYGREPLVMGTTFPAALFAWDGSSYSSATNPASWQGYWCKVTQAAVVTVTGVAGPHTVNLTTGWNLIGNSMNTAATLTLPGVPAFVYNPATQGYSSTTSLLPGQGAWVKGTSGQNVVLTPAS